MKLKKMKRRKRRKRRLASIDNQSLSVQSERISVSTPPSTVRLNVGTGVAIGRDSDQIGYSLNLGLAFRTSRNSSLFLGLDAGVDYWDYGIEEAQVSASLMTIRLLPTVYYHLTGRDSSVRPFIGLSAGPVIMKSSITVQGQEVEIPIPGVTFEVLLRAGLEIELSKGNALCIESKFGFIRRPDQLIFLPQVHWVFSL